MSRWLLAAWAALAGCSGDVIDLSVALSVDQSTCGFTDPGATWLPCGGRVGVWLLAEDGAVLDERCILFDPQPLTIAELPDLLAPVSFDGLAAGDKVAVEIAVFRGDDGSSTCTRFADGEGTFPVYFGQSEVVTLDGDTPPLAIALACYEFVGEPCAEAWLQVSATLTDLGTWQQLLAEPPLVSVSAGVVTTEGNYIEGTVLEWQGLEWLGQILATPTPDQCVGVAATFDGTLWPFLSCESFVEGGFATVQGYSLETWMLENLLALLGPEDPGFMGVGLGRVVTYDNQPVSGVEIVPQDPRITISYLSADMMSLDANATAEHGYFVVRGETPGCCFRFAEALPYGLVEVQPFGLVPGFLTLFPARVNL